MYHEKPPLRLFAGKRGYLFQEFFLFYKILKIYKTSSINAWLRKDFFKTLILIMFTR